MSFTEDEQEAEKERDECYDSKRLDIRFPFLSGQPAGFFNFLLTDFLRKTEILHLPYLLLAE